MNLHLSTHPDTYSPSKYVYSWLQGEHIRLIRSSSRYEDYKLALSKFTRNLQRRNYDHNLIQVELGKNSFSERSSLLVYPRPPREEAALTKRLFIHNIYGRSFIAKMVKRAYKLANCLSSPMNRPTANFIVYRGVNLQQKVERNNKMLLKQMGTPSELS